MTITWEIVPMYPVSIVPDWAWVLFCAAASITHHSRCMTPLCPGSYYPNVTEIEGYGHVLDACCPCGSSGWTLDLPRVLVPEAADG